MKLNTKDIFKILLLSIGIFLFVLDLFIINVSLPSIQNHLHLSNSKTQWIIILYIIGYASILINAGNAGTVYGRKKLYLLGMIGFTLSSLMCGLSQNIYMLLFGRLLQGISSALMVPQGISLITVLYENQQKRTLAFGIYGSIAGLSSVLGQFLGGLLPDLKLIEESWRLIFLVNVPFGMLAILITYLIIPKDIIEINTTKSKIKDVFQLFILMILLLYPLIVGPEENWSVWIIVLLFFSVLLIVLFVKHQKKLFLSKQNSLIDFSLFKNRVFNYGLLSALAYYMVQDAYFIINSNYLQNYKNFTPTMTGIAFVYQGIGYVFASLIASRLLDKNGKIVIISGLSIMMICLLFHLIIYNQVATDVNKIHLLFFCYGIGCGTVLPALMTIALRDLNEKLIGVGSSLYLTIQQISICLGIAFIVGLYYNHSKISFFYFPLVSEAYVYSTILSIILLTLVGYFTTKIFKTHKNNSL